jgi:adenylyltransferase/sulfurtransferase
VPALTEKHRQRYDRQFRLGDIGEAGQRKLLGSSVLVIGLGGLGCPAAIYLTAAGVGRIVINDFDTVELSNLTRQIGYGTEQVRQSKVDSMRDHLLHLNPDANVESVGHVMEADELQRRVAEADVVVDCTDNFSTRFAINAACLAAGTPWVSAAAIRFEAQLTTYHPRDAQSPCYRCLYPEGTEAAESCLAEGVLGPLVGTAGCVQAIETLKLLLGIGRSLVGRLLLFDAMQMSWHEIRLKRDPGCPACGDSPQAATS